MRRLVQYRLSTLLVFVAIIGGGLRLVVLPAERQRRAVAAIEGLGGLVWYDFEDFKDRPLFVCSFVTDPSPAPAPAGWRGWIGKMAGVDFVAHVKVVDFEECTVADDQLRWLACLRSLEKLNLAATGLPGSGLVHVSGLTCLKSLDLRDNLVSDEDLVHLSRLVNLEYLDLSDTELSDVGLAYVTALPQLKELRLDGTQVTDAGLAHLTRLTGLSDLTLIDNADELTSSGIEELQKALPECNIYAIVNGVEVP